MVVVIGVVVGVVVGVVNGVVVWVVVWVVIGVVVGVVVWVVVGVVVGVVVILLQDASSGTGGPDTLSHSATFSENKVQKCSSVLKNTHPGNCVHNTWKKD